MGTGVANRLFKCDAVQKYDLSSVKSLNFSGAIVKPEVEDFLIKAFPNAHICQAYGCSEVGGITFTSEATGKHCSNGKVCHNIYIKVINIDSGEILGPDQDGEICTKSPDMILEYYKDPENTAKLIDSEGWYHTGDLGHYDEDGEFFLVDRIKELIKYRYFHVSPSSIENIILGHPEVIEVGVVAKPDNDDVEQPIAFVIIRADANVK